MLVRDQFGQVQVNSYFDHCTINKCNKRFAGLKSAVLSQRKGYNTPYRRIPVRADCALRILPCSESGCEGEEALYLTVPKVLENRGL